MAADPDPRHERALWPSGCPKPNSCERHRACVYNCWRRDSDIAAEIDTAVALRKAERRTACEVAPSWPPVVANRENSATLPEPPGFEAGVAAGELRATRRIVAWLRERVADHRDHGKHAAEPLRSDQITVAWIIEHYADAIERGEHDLAPRISPPRGG